MPYVRARMQAASKEYARRRVEINRRILALDPANSGARFNGAFDWFRAASVYAARRSYRSLAIGEAAHARRELITADAAAMLQEHADKIDAIVPESPRRRTRRAGYRAAYGSAATTPERMEAARVWFLFMAAQAERCRDSAVTTAAAAIKDGAATRLIGWAAEMDADNYGEAPIGGDPR